MRFYFISLDLSYDGVDSNQVIALNPEYENKLECKLTGHPKITYKWKCKVCSPSGSASLIIPANSAVDGDVETITCTGSVEGK